MAVARKKTVKGKVEYNEVVDKIPLSWRRFVIALSVAANIAFVVIVVTMATTNALDGMFMKEGLSRYCDTANDSKFGASTAEVKALRDYTCARDDAREHFQKGFNDYMHVKNIEHAH